MKQKDSDIMPILEIINVRTTYVFLNNSKFITKVQHLGCPYQENLSGTMLVRYFGGEANVDGNFYLHSRIVPWLSWVDHPIPQILEMVNYNKQDVVDLEFS